MKKIPDYSRIDRCQSDLFDINNIRNLTINKFDDLFLLFVPDIFMETPFQFLLTHNCYTSFHNISGGINKNDFSEFINKYLDKFVEMFIFIFECASYYNKTSIKECYCHLSYDDDIDYIDEDIENI